jgi:hypothetical protein
MTKNEQALSGLQEIPLPPAVPYTPQTIGWVFLGALLVVALCLAIRRLYRQWMANRYRRTALARLCKLEKQLADPSRRLEALTAIPPLIKQTVLSFCTRNTVAGLSDRNWLEFLDRTYPPGGFAQGPGRLLPRLAYEAPAYLTRIPESEVNELLSLVRHWISHHHARI